jgi:hypothetical protein
VDLTAHLLFPLMDIYIFGVFVILMETQPHVLSVFVLKLKNKFVTLVQLIGLQFTHWKLEVGKYIFGEN